MDKKDKKPYHKKRKQGTRTFFKRTKNDIRKRFPGKTVSKRDNAQATARLLSLSAPTLPFGWKYDLLDSDISFYTISKDKNDIPHIHKSISLKGDRTWSVFACGRTLPASSEVLNDCPLTVQSSDDLMKILEVIDKAVLCLGNPDPQFMSLCQTRGGATWGDRGCGEIVAFIDSNVVVYSIGQSYPSTVRRCDCDILCTDSCHSCEHFRSTLRSAVSRYNRRDSDSLTHADSHTGYCHMTPNEKDKRLRNLHHSLRSVKQQVKRLEAKAEVLIQKNGVSLQPDDADDIANVVSDVAQVAKDSFPPDSPQRVFWEQQVKYNALRNKRQMRWHQLMIRFALNLKYLSSSAYQGIVRTGLIALPSERTLIDYTHWITPHSGVQYEFVEHSSKLRQPIIVIFWLDFNSPYLHNY